MVQPEIYLLTAHEPYTDPRHPVPINALIVHARTLLHPAVPQPDGGLMYRCLTEFPGRRPGELVPLSTLTYELDGGNLWHQIGDWEAVTNALVAVARAGGCDSLPLGLPTQIMAPITAGPTSSTQLFHTDGHVEQLGPEHRQREIEQLAGHVHRFFVDQPCWAGNNLLTSPAVPAVLPYRPWTSNR